ncbi:MAG: hypothetical protein ACP5R5_12550 [Armatimonadota bacterium]
MRTVSAVVIRNVTSCPSTYGVILSTTVLTGAKCLLIEAIAVERAYRKSLFLGC